MNLAEIILEYFPDANDEDMEDLLWTCTPFPFTDKESIIRERLGYYKEHGGGSINGAIAYSMQELDNAINHINNEDI